MTAYNSGTGPFDRVRQEFDRWFETAKATVNGPSTLLAWREKDVPDCRHWISGKPITNCICWSICRGSGQYGVELALLGPTLQLKARRQLPVIAVEGAKQHLRERQQSGYERTLTLPTSVDPDSVRAVACDGLLYVTLKKRPDLQADRFRSAARDSDYGCGSAVAPPGGWCALQTLLDGSGIAPVPRPFPARIRGTLGRVVLTREFAGVVPSSKHRFEEGNAPAATGPCSAAIRELTRPFGPMHTDVIDDLPLRDVEAVAQRVIQFHSESRQGESRSTRESFRGGFRADADRGMRRGCVVRLAAWRRRLRAQCQSPPESLSGLVPQRLPSD